MKKTILIFAVAAMSFAACSKEEVPTTGKVMTISAEVDDGVKATISDNGDKTWTFKWTSGDEAFVKDPDGSKCKFTWVEGNKFEGMATPQSGTWTAVFPYSAGTDNIKFSEQDGTIEDAMSKYLLKGTYESDGSSVLSFKMKPHFAVLKITNNTGLKVTNIAYFDGSKYFAYYTSANYLGGYSDFTGIFKFGYGITNGNTAYFIAPAAKYCIEYVTDDGHSTTTEKTVEAGHIYNVTLE